MRPPDFAPVAAHLIGAADRWNAPGIGILAFHAPAGTTRIRVTSARHFAHGLARARRRYPLGGAARHRLRRSIPNGTLPPPDPIRSHFPDVATGCTTRCVCHHIQSQIASSRHLGYLPCAAAMSCCRRRMDAEAGPVRGHRRAIADQAGPRPDGAGHPLRAHGGAQQDAPAPGPGAHGDLPDRRLHVDDRRPVRPQRHAPAADARADRGQRQDLLRAGSLVLDPANDRDPLQPRVERPAGRARHDPAGRQVHGGAHAGARRFRQALRRPAARSACTSSSTR